ncbi:spore coat protein U-like protein [Variovorax sp. TBS-050B]|uniref:Csu type fimbrial protein n=1 Tax=Variovorax sp. TBS-050B TaxID=2940551 RepID=UPI0024736D73|nr:spore coat U domain-containing protein [Variovorax sp. TBS-050B]MDH6593937.1 spore coat protein U-like protein [Variovorax sp. TBS-050B]
MKSAPSPAADNHLLVRLAALALLLAPAYAWAQSCTSASFRSGFGPTTVDIVPDTTASAGVVFEARCTSGSNTLVTYCLYVAPVGTQQRDNNTYYVTATPDSRLAWRMTGGSGGVQVSRDGAGIATTGQTCGGGANAPCSTNTTYTITYLPRQQQDRVRPGIYTQTFNAKALVGAAATGGGTAAYCSTPPPGTQVVNSTFTVNANVLTNCQIENVANIDFGSQGSVSTANSGATALRAFGNVGVRCTYETPYTLTIDNGQHASAGVRRMQSGSNFLSYQLFQPGCTTAWNATSSLSGTGNTVNAINNHQVCAQLTAPLAVAPPAGTYTDTVVITATF